MVGKTLKSKINGALFYVEDLITEQGRQYYIIKDVASGGTTCWGKEWFEKGLMHEEKVIAFEQFVVNCFITCKRIIVGHYRRWKRLRGKTNGKTNKKTHL